MSLKEIEQICPEAFFVPSNYTAYAIYARRMYAIAKRFTPLVHEYSIDECFADITGLDERYHESYEAIALKIKAALEECLGITFGRRIGSQQALGQDRFQTSQTSRLYRDPDRQDNGISQRPADRQGMGDRKLDERIPRQLGRAHRA